MLLHVAMYLMCGPRQLFFSMAQKHWKVGHSCFSLDLVDNIYIFPQISNYYNLYYA